MNKLSKIRLLFQTVIHIKLIQIMYQIYYRFVKRKTTIGNNAPQESTVDTRNLKFSSGFKYASFLSTDRTFNFLNLKKEFTTIDWNYAEHGKLWTYNLNYFEFLLQSEMTVELGTELMSDFCSKYDQSKDGKEPYPTSLRLINWIKFMLENKVKNSHLDAIIYHDSYRLLENLEYHILANHLLENGFGLLFSGVYLNDTKILKQAKTIIKAQLSEQILLDGAHYELSPMYHKIILMRCLDSYHLLVENKIEPELTDLLHSKIQCMLNWLKAISFNNGTIPMLNDSAPGITIENEAIFNYAKRLDFTWKASRLSDSGYRKFDRGDFELIFDVGQIAPSYQPGHSHADNLNFVLNYKDKNIVVDTGISTYEKNERRQLERSSISHNVVTISNINSSAVWGGFRVGKRAKTKIVLDSDMHCMATHNGYRNQKIEVSREIDAQSSTLFIYDKVNKATNSTVGHIHLHPSLKIHVVDKTIVINDEIVLQFTHCTSLKLEEYHYCTAYNLLEKATKIIYEFEVNSTLEIKTI